LYNFDTLGNPRSPNTNLIESAEKLSNPTFLFRTLLRQKVSPIFDFEFKTFGAMKISIAEFVEMISGELLQAGTSDRVEKVIIDSRHVSAERPTVFIAIRGTNHDGHLFIQNLYDRGMRIFVVETNPLELPDATIIKVKDTAQALQTFAAAYRSRFALPVVAITGSNGKTIVKEWLYQALYPDFQIVRSPKSYNSQVGVPLSLLLIEPQHNMGIFEAGISMPGEMDRLREMIQPNMGIFTNIGAAHQENFSSIEAKVSEKLKLFSQCETLIYCADEVLVHQKVKSDLPLSVNTISWGQSPDADFRILSAEPVDAKHTQLTGIWKGKERKLTVPYQLDASIENLCHIWVLMILWSYSDDDISQRLSDLETVSMRLQILEGIKGCTLVNDAYNSDLNAIEIALDFLKTQVKNPNFTAILSDIQQTGEEGSVLYHKLADLLILKGIDRFIGIGPELKAHQLLFKNVSSSFYPGTAQFLAEWRKLGFSRENILLKGARSFQFEQIADALQEKTHETVLEINFNKMANNLGFIRSKLKRNTQLIAMVKAFGYGSGAYEVARFLSYYGVDYLAVAYADEGFDLRSDGIETPILVLNPEASSFDAMIRFRLEPQIFSFRILDAFERAAQNAALELPFPIHVKINTGMNRLGFDTNEIPKLSERLHNLKSLLTVKSVFSHLSSSENIDFDGTTANQIKRFETASREIEDALGHTFMRHILNSSGILRHPKAEFDAVRLGLGLYGLISQTEARDDFNFVSRLITRISQIRTVAAGEGVGYSPKKPLDRESRIAVIPIGYADGLPRALGNGRSSVKINGELCPFVGNICMDMSMVDVTNLDCVEGDQVVIFENGADIYRLSEALDTIPYELLTQISNRVKRVYIQE